MLDAELLIKLLHRSLTKAFRSLQCSFICALVSSGSSLQFKSDTDGCLRLSSSVMSVAVKKTDSHLLVAGQGWESPCPSFKSPSFRALLNMNFPDSFTTHLENECLLSSPVCVPMVCVIISCIAVLHFPQPVASRLLCGFFRISQVHHKMLFWVAVG